MEKSSLRSKQKILIGVGLISFPMIFALFYFSIQDQNLSKNVFPDKEKTEAKVEEKDLGSQSSISNLLAQDKSSSNTHQPNQQNHQDDKINLMDSKNSTENIKGMNCGDFGTIHPNDPNLANFQPNQNVQKIDAHLNSDNYSKTDEEWRSILSPLTYHVTRQKGTERAFTGEYTDNKKAGLYECVCCGEPLFDSDTKYNSGSGWPSFFAPLNLEAIETDTDVSHGMKRVEVHCRKCNAHLGHVFPDGPRPTGMRYCINSVSLKFKSK